MKRTPAILRGVAAIMALVFFLCTAASAVMVYKKKKTAEVK